jgi:hypothetical protein
MSLLRSPLWKRLQVSLQLACPRLFSRIALEQTVAMLHYLKCQNIPVERDFLGYLACSFCGLSRDERKYTVERVVGIDWSLNWTILEETFFNSFFGGQSAILRHNSTSAIPACLLHHVARANQTSSKLENRSEILQGKELSSASYSKVFACFSTESASLASFTRFSNIFKDAQ